jgi:phosphatidylethanolamine/phosphatidyl-N-methylethanolamine N-methyltransferase
MLMTFFGQLPIAWFRNRSTNCNEPSLSCCLVKFADVASAGIKGIVASLDWAVFFGLWLRNPLRLAAANPSGRVLADAVARQLDLTRPGHVLELGAGTGSLTHGILRCGCPVERLVVVEREDELVDVLQRRFPRLRILAGDAARLGDLLANDGISALATVVSSLPIKWFPRLTQAAILDQSFDLLGPGGCFLQLTNAFASPLPGVGSDIAGAEVERVWRNFLPTQIWCFRRGSNPAFTDRSSR